MAADTGRRPGDNQDRTCPTEITQSGQAGTSCPTREKMDLCRDMAFPPRKINEGRRACHVPKQPR